jgi:hypothetical protein
MRRISGHIKFTFRHQFEINPQALVAFLNCLVSSPTESRPPIVGIAGSRV